MVPCWAPPISLLFGAFPVRERFGAEFKVFLLTGITLVTPTLLHSMVEESSAGIQVIVGTFILPILGDNPLEPMLACSLKEELTILLGGPAVI